MGGSTSKPSGVKRKVVYLDPGCIHCRHLKTVMVSNPGLWQKTGVEMVECTRASSLGFTLEKGFPHTYEFFGDKPAPGSYIHNPQWLSGVMRVYRSSYGNM